MQNTFQHNREPSVVTHRWCSGSPRNIVRLPSEQAFSFAGIPPSETAELVCMDRIGVLRGEGGCSRFFPQCGAWIFAASTLFSIGCRLAPQARYCCSRLRLQACWVRFDALTHLRRVMQVQTALRHCRMSLFRRYFVQRGIKLGNRSLYG